MPSQMHLHEQSPEPDLEAKQVSSLHHAACAFVPCLYCSNTMLQHLLTAAPR